MPKTTVKSALVRDKKPKEGADMILLPSVRHLSNRSKILIIGGGMVAVVLIAIVGLRIGYNGRIYPGVSGLGIYLGGLTSEEAISRLNSETANYNKSQISIDTPQGNIQTSVDELGVQYDNRKTVDLLMSLGRSGNFFSQIGTQFSYMLFGKDSTDQVKVVIPSDKFSDLYNKVAGKTNSAVQNARFSFTLPDVAVETQKDGVRLDPASFNSIISDHFGTLDKSPISIRGYVLHANIDSSLLSPHLDQAKDYTSSDLVLTSGKKTWTIEQPQIIDWLSVTSNAGQISSADALLKHYYLRNPEVTVAIDQVAVRSYLTNLSKEIDVTPVDAQLTVVDGRATVFAAARDGATLDVDKSLELVLAALDKTQEAQSQRQVTLAIATRKADVSNETIDQLGILDLLSEGSTTFPGSSAARITNIRVGARRFNGVLLKPGEVFSFGKLLGDVGPAQGYVEGRVILEGRQESQYGGGLCQVSSTAFRAALLAGLPIVERHNHSFAVSYYTAPYGVPGVDATIYYPSVDFKFRNDTKAHILIQTEMKGTSLKFRFYGTKEKSGVIRGPQFVTGSNDPNQPSKTVFWRDVVVNGQVTKTDTFNTSYKSALDYPPIQ